MGERAAKPDAREHQGCNRNPDSAADGESHAGYRRLDDDHPSVGNRKPGLPGPSASTAGGSLIAGPIVESGARVFRDERLLDLVQVETARTMVSVPGSRISRARMSPASPTTSRAASSPQTDDHLPIAPPCHNCAATRSSTTATRRGERYRRLKCRGRAQRNPHGTQVAGHDAPMHADRRRRLILASPENAACSEPALKEVQASDAGRLDTGQLPHARDRVSIERRPAIHRRGELPEIQRKLSR